MSSDVDAEYEVFKDLLPNGAVPATGFRIIAYFNEQGEYAYKMSHIGDDTVATLVGLLELVKTNILYAINRLQQDK